MTTPRSFNEYLAALNASLELGLRSRWRIFREVADHLEEAAERELAAGASWEQAQRRAIAAFGSPQEVAAGFESGLFGALDKRLALAAGRLDVWLAQHPWGGVAVRLVFVALLAGLLAAFGAAFGASDPGEVAATAMVFGAIYALHRGAQARALAGRPERGLWERLRAGAHELSWPLREEPSPAAWGGPPIAAGALMIYLHMVDGEDLLALAAVFLAVVLLAHGLTGHLTRVASRRYAATDERTLAGVREDVLLRLARRLPPELSEDEARRQAWRADHPWLAALLEISTVPLALSVLVLVGPGALELRIALAALIVVMTAVLAGCLRLIANAADKSVFDRMAGDEPRASAVPHRG